MENTQNKKEALNKSTKTIKIVCRKNGEMVVDDVAANKFDQLDVDGKVINLFIHRDYENKNKWAITEEATGLLVGSQFKTKNDAIKAYKETLKDRVVYLLKYNYSNYLKAVAGFKELLEKVSA